MRDTPPTIRSKIAKLRLGESYAFNVKPIDDNITECVVTVIRLPNGCLYKTGKGETVYVADLI